MHEENFSRTGQLRGSGEVKIRQIRKAFRFPVRMGGWEGRGRGLENLLNHKVKQSRSMQATQCRLFLRNLKSQETFEFYCHSHEETRKKTTVILGVLWTQKANNLHSWENLPTSWSRSESQLRSSEWNGVQERQVDSIEIRLKKKKNPDSIEAWLQNQILEKSRFWKE